MLKVAHFPPKKLVYSILFQVIDTPRMEMKKDAGLFVAAIAMYLVRVR